MTHDVAPNHADMKSGVKRHFAPDATRTSMMRTMRFINLWSYLGALTASGAFGACLLDDYSLTAEYGRSAAVVQAQVMSEHDVADPDAPEFIGGTIYKVRIEQSFRGELHGTAEVFSENSTGRFPIEKKKTYLLFLYRLQGRLSADPCGNSGLAAQKTNELATVRALSKSTRAEQKLKRK